MKALCASLSLAMTVNIVRTSFSSGARSVAAGIKKCSCIQR